MKAMLTQELEEVGKSITNKMVQLIEEKMEDKMEDMDQKLEEVINKHQKAAQKRGGAEDGKKEGVKKVRKIPKSDEVKMMATRRTRSPGTGEGPQKRK